MSFGFMRFWIVQRVKLYKFALLRGVIDIFIFVFNPLFKMCTKIVELWKVFGRKKRELSRRWYPCQIKSITFSTLNMTKSNKFALELGDKCNWNGSQTQIIINVSRTVNFTRVFNSTICFFFNLAMEITNKN